MSNYLNLKSNGFGGNGNGKTETVTQKMCKKCGLVLPASKFSKNNTAVDGLQVWCIDCNKKYQKERTAIRHALKESREVSANIMSIKTCKKCHRSYPNTNQYFPKDGHSPGKLSGVCKNCKRDRDRISQRKRQQAALKANVAQYPAGAMPNTENSPLRIMINGVYYVPENRLAELQKKCSKCGKYYPATLEYFAKDSSKKGGLRGQCRMCKKESDRNMRKYREWLEAEKERADGDANNQSVIMVDGIKYKPI